jgi:hypothetical protein
MAETSPPEPPIHSMSDKDRAVAREVLTAAWTRLAATAAPPPPAPPAEDPSAATAASSPPAEGTLSAAPPPPARTPSAAPPPAEGTPAAPPLPAEGPSAAAAASASAEGTPAAASPGGSTTGGPILAAVRTAATILPEFRVDVSGDYARFAAEAAVWYLDRAVRRVADPDRDGWTATQRANNLAWFASTASSADLEALFAMAIALNADDA